MITIVGIRHTENSNEQLKRLIGNRRPHAICVELDVFRYRLLKNQLSPDEIRTYFNDMPGIYRLISLFKQKSQKEHSVDREWDSKTVLDVASEVKAEVMPIDMDQSSIYWEIERNIRLLEKMRIFLSLIKEFFSYKKIETREKDIDEAFSKNFPTLKRCLIDRRDEFMSKEIKKHAAEYEKLMVVVGNAHLKGISCFIGDLNPEVIDVDMLNKI